MDAQANNGEIANALNGNPVQQVIAQQPQNGQNVDNNGIVQNQPGPNNIFNGFDEADLNNAIGAQAINTVLIKVPFPSMQNVNHIELWFAQMQSWFELNRVTADKTMYNMVVAHLRHDVLSQVEDLIRTPPLIDRFQTIKNTIIARFADSERTRVHKLVSGITLGDKKPSHLLQELRRANVGNDETLLKTLFIQRLPTQAQASVSIAQGNLTEIAALADVVVETLRIGNNNYNVSEIQQASSGSSSDKRIDELIKAISELKAERNSRGRSRSRGAGDQSSRGRTPAREYDMCWYHYKFRNNAKKCGKNADPPKNCNWSSKN